MTIVASRMAGKNGAFVIGFFAYLRPRRVLADGRFPKSASYGSGLSTTRPTSAGFASVTRIRRIAPISRICQAPGGVHFARTSSFSSACFFSASVTAGPTFRARQPDGRLPVAER